MPGKLSLSSQQALTKSAALESTPVKIRSQVSFRYVYVGKSKRYAFDPGQALFVDQEDVQGILAIVSRGGGCCGNWSPGGKPYFKLED